MATCCTDVTAEDLKRAGLRYVSCSSVGYKRIKGKEGFRYQDTKGKRIYDKHVLARIDALKIPPAWEDVWICAHHYGHIQATGRDARGRKQYRYHAAWNKLRKADKFSNLYHFGKCLPAVEKQMQQDLRIRYNTKRKVCALALSVMNKTYLRSGNTHYEKTNHSYGLTTLHNKHLNEVSTHKVFFRFKGKKGVTQQIYLKEKGLINKLKQIKEIPGQHLFQYYDEDGNVCHLESGDLNEYLTQITGAGNTCKNFRTWHACLLSLQQLSAAPLPDTKKEREKLLIQVTDDVALALGNTRTVTKNHYIHPHIYTAYLNGSLDQWIKRMQRQKGTKTDAKPFHRKLLLILQSN